MAEIEKALKYASANNAIENMTLTKDEIKEIEKKLIEKEKKEEEAKKNGKTK